MDLIPGGETEIPRAVEQLSLCATARETAHTSQDPPGPSADPARRDRFDAAK